MANCVQQKPVQLNISFHAWNGDYSLVALSPNNDEVWIYKTNNSFESSKWDKEPAWKLKEHGGYVSGIDWHKESDTLVTCGHDRNAYVWKYDKAENDWKPTLVILRINRAATSVKWSPNGKKFAVTSGAKCVPICHFEESNDWWISKMIKKHKSTVTSVAWSPNSKYIVTGACDFKCRIISAYIEGLDSPDDDMYAGIWKANKEFGEELAVFDGSKAWVNSVSWSPNGKAIAFAGHGSSFHFAHFGADGPATGVQQEIFLKSLPFLNCEFLTDNTVVAVGFDNNPRIFVNQGSDSEPKWEELAKCDKEEPEKKAAPKSKGFGSAFSKFQQADSQGQKFGAKSTEKECLTNHKNTVLDLKILSPTTISTSSIDGRLLHWDLSPISGMK